MTDLDSAVSAYMKHFAFNGMMMGCPLDPEDHYSRFYSTGDPDRDAAIIRECIRLNTQIRIPAMDRSVEYAKELIDSETERLHMLVPA